MDDQHLQRIRRRLERRRADAARVLRANTCPDIDGDTDTLSMPPRSWWQRLCDAWAAFVYD